MIILWSTGVKKMADYYSGNYFLSLPQMQVNATYLYGLLNREGWTLNAIAGGMGNWQTESTLNPGIWQNLKENPKLGYGLVQWTPSTKYTDWCASQGLEPSYMQSAVARLSYEVSHPSEQWGETSQYPMSFSDFITSTESPRYLAMVFLYNYEKPKNLNQPKRGTQAEYWYTYLSGEEPPDPGPGPDPGPEPGPPDKNIYTSGRNLLIPLLRRRKYGTLK